MHFGEHIMRNRYHYGLFRNTKYKNHKKSKYFSFKHIQRQEALIFLLVMMGAIATLLINDVLYDEVSIEV